MHPFNRRAPLSRLSTTVCVAVAMPSEGGRNPLRLFLESSVFGEPMSFVLERSISAALFCRQSEQFL